MVLMMSPQAPRSRTDRLGFKTDHPLTRPNLSKNVRTWPKLPTWAIQQSRQLDLGYFRRAAAVAGTAGLARFRSAVNALLLRKNDQPRRTASLSFEREFVRQGAFAGGWWSGTLHGRVRGIFRKIQPFKSATFASVELANPHRTAENSLAGCHTRRSRFV
jgi:hypothetical protein